MIQETYKIGAKITDLDGVEWTIWNTWQYKDWWCMALDNPLMPGAGGGYRIKLHGEEGGALVAVR